MLHSASLFHNYLIDGKKVISKRYKPVDTVQNKAPSLPFPPQNKGTNNQVCQLELSTSHGIGVFYYYYLPPFAASICQKQNQTRR